MSEQNMDSIPNSQTLLTSKGGEVLSCKSNAHPKFGTEYSCQGSDSEVYIDKKLPLEKVFSRPFRTENKGPLVWYTNPNGDLLISPELTNGKSIILKKNDLWTNVPPKGSIVTKVTPESDGQIIITPGEWVWGINDSRELNHDEIMRLIIKKLQELEAKERPIGPRASIDANMEILAMRTGYEENNAEIA